MKYFVAILIVVSTIGTASSQSQWVHANGPFASGSVTSVFAMDSALFVGGNGVYRSTDAGLSWVALTSISGVHIFLQRGSLLFLALDHGIVVSTDRGNHWKESDSGLALGTPVFALAQDDSGLYAGAYSTGVYRSTDNGSHWQPANEGLTNTSTRALLVRDSSIFVATAGGIFRSRDHGRHWTRIDSGLSFVLTSALAATDSVLVAGTYGGGFFRSTDDGDTWTRSVDSLGTTNITSIAAQGLILVATTANGMARSTDHARSWQSIPGSWSFTPNVVVVAPSALYLGTINGLYRSNDAGVHWQACGYAQTSVQSLTVVDTSLYAGATYGGVFQTNDRGNHWKCVAPWFVNRTVYALAQSDTNLVAGSVGILLSNPHQPAFHSNDTLLTNSYVYSFASNGSYLFAGTYSSGIFRSSDNGETWEGANSGIASTYLKKLVACGPVLLAGMSDDDVYRSTDNGDDWSPTGLKRPYSAVAGLGTAGDVVVASILADTLFRSTDRGATWSSIPFPYDAWLVAFARDGGHIFASNAYGTLFASLDAGYSWSLVDSLKQYVTALAVYQGDIYAATQSGIWHRPLAGLGVPTNRSTSSDTDVTILPNPSEGELHIMNIPNGYRRLSVRDVLGKIILAQDLRNGSSIDLHLQIEPPGAYFLELEGDGHNIMRKFILR